MGTTVNKTEAYFIPHCDGVDDIPCDLGVFQYTCPHCNETVSDYDIWWEEDDIWRGNPASFNCEKCNEMLTVEWIRNEFKYWVK